MIEIKDIVGLSKPLTRLIEVISQGVGGVSAPYLIKKKAEAKAYEIRVISEALKDVAEQHHLPVVYKDGGVELWQTPEDKTLTLDPLPPHSRAELRLNYQDRKRQSNIENISSVAAIELAGESEVPDVKPDEDWISRFFNFAQDVSSEQMQDLWGRILAGEIKKPGTYSLRTLEFIRNITKSDATLLEHIGKLAIHCKATAFVAMHDKTWIQQNRNIYPGHHFLISELGALYPTDLQLKVFRETSVSEELFISGSLMLLVKRGEIKNQIQLPIWKFTSVGQELIELIPNANDEEYLESLGHFFLKHKAEATLTKIIKKLPNGQIQYQSIREIYLPQSSPPP